jgi:hypothetical protein
LAAPVVHSISQWMSWSKPHHCSVTPIAGFDPPGLAPILLVASPLFWWNRPHFFFSLCVVKPPNLRSSNLHLSYLII